MIFKKKKFSGFLQLCIQVGAQTSTSLKSGQLCMSKYTVSPPPSAPPAKHSPQPSFPPFALKSVFCPWQLWQHLVYYDGSCQMNTLEKKNAFFQQEWLVTQFTFLQSHWLWRPVLNLRTVRSRIEFWWPSNSCQLLTSAASPLNHHLLSWKRWSDVGLNATEVVQFPCEKQNDLK